MNRGGRRNLPPPAAAPLGPSGWPSISEGRTPERKPNKANGDVSDFPWKQKKINGDRLVAWSDMRGDGE